MLLTAGKNKVNGSANQRPVVQKPEVYKNWKFEGKWVQPFEVRHPGFCITLFSLMLWDENSVWNVNTGTFSTQ